MYIVSIIFFVFSISQIINLSWSLYNVFLLPASFNDVADRIVRRMA